MKIEASLTLPEFRRKHGVSNAKCHRDIKKGVLRAVRGADGLQRILESDEYRWLFGQIPPATIRGKTKATIRQPRGIGRPRGAPL